MSEVLAKWDEALYDARKPEIMMEVDSKYCAIVEWVEQVLPDDEADIRKTIASSGPCLPQEIIDKISKLKEQKLGKKIKVLCLADESGLTQSVLEAMEKHKSVASKKVVNVYGSGAMDEESLATLLGEGWDMLVFGCGVDPPESNDPDDIIKWSDEIIKIYLRVVKHIFNNPKDVKKVCVLTSGTFSDDTKVHQESGAGITTSAHLFGMTNAVRMEIQTTPFHYIDVDWMVDPKIIDAAAYEISRRAGFGEATVRLTSEGRFVGRMVLAQPKYTSNQKFVTPSKGFIGIGGGNGGLGLVMGKYFIDHLEDKQTANLTIKFLSRSCRVTGDNLKLWTDLQKSVEGTSVTVLQAICDVSNRGAVETFVSDHAGELCGFVHSAGILRDAMIGNQTEEMFEEVFKPKAWAGLYLHHALEKQPTPNFKFLWMFSSVSVYGNPGQSNYAGANSVLDCLSRHRKALGKPCTVMQWAGWGEVGMAASMGDLQKKRWEDSPMPLFSNAQGLAGMDVGLSTGLPYFCVMRFNSKAFFEQNNKDHKFAAERYQAKFWSAQAPSLNLTELDLYENVCANYYHPKEMIFNHFITGDRTTDLPIKTTTEAAAVVTHVIEDAE